MTTKLILDACCGPKYMWVDKNNPNTLFIDIRREEKGFIEREPNCSISPDIIADFTNLPAEIKAMRFKLIVWDVPHFRVRRISGDLLKKWGNLNPETWQSDLTKGFSELWGVLDDYGVLLFKFSDYHIKFNEVMADFQLSPSSFSPSKLTFGRNNR